MISAGPVGAYTDMWSFGVLLYVALSGVSPFLDDSDDETVNNVLRCDFSFPPEHFSAASPSARDLVSRLLVVDPSSRAPASAALASAWVSEAGPASSNPIPSAQLANLVRRRGKKLNAVAPMAMSASNSRMTGAHPHATRPESLYRSGMP